MLKTVKRFLTVTASAVLVVFFCCCQSAYMSVPYAIEQVSVDAGFSSGGGEKKVRFTLCNTSQRTIVDFTVVLVLYDSEDESALETPIIAACSVLVEPGACERCVVPLDAFLDDESDSAVTVGEIYLRTIRFETGSRWRDPFGVFGKASVCD